MKILYLSSHSVLEYDELSLLTELDDLLAPEERLNVEVFSLGAYSNPTQSGDFLRSVIPKGRFYTQLHRVYMQCSKDMLHPELVDWADVILSMHNSRVPGQKAQQPWISNNWKMFQEKNKRVIWRSIGQSTPEIEKELKKLRLEGLQIVRYSPLEEKIPNYAGHDAFIRFAKDEDEFRGWTGERLQVITFAQSFKKRGDHLGYDLWEKATEGFQRKVFGTENEDLGSINGGQRTYHELKEEMKQNRVFFYTGTKPAPYTLSLIEAMMTGMPVVAVGPRLRGDDEGAYRWPNYEIPDIISNGLNGFYSDDMNELRGFIQLLMDDQEKARQIGLKGRETAIKLWNKKQRMREWIDFLRR